MEKFNKYKTNKNIHINPNCEPIVSELFLDLGHCWVDFGIFEDMDRCIDIRIYKDTLELGIEIVNGIVFQDSLYNLAKYIKSDDEYTRAEAQEMYDRVYKILVEYEEQGILKLDNFKYGDDIVKY